MAMFWTSELIAAHLLLYLGLAALVVHCLGCFLVVARCWRQPKTAESMAGGRGEGVTFLCLVESGQSLPAVEQSLRAAFMVNYRKKEIIICQSADEQEAGAQAEIIRKIREDYAETASLLLSGSDRGGPKGSEQNSLAKGWKVARYDWVMLIAPGLVVPPDCLTRFSPLWGEGRHSAKARKTGLVSAALWGVGAQTARARLEAAFLNSWQARRLLLADSLHQGVGQNSAQLWHYDIMNNAGGINAFIEAGGAGDMAAAATQLVRCQGKKIRLAALPLPKNLAPAAQPLALDGVSYTSAAALLARQVRRLRFYRCFLPRWFYAEPFLGAFLPILAVALAHCAGAATIWQFIGFVALWYGVEIWLVFCLNRAVGGKNSNKGRLKQSAVLPLRDIILPFLWLYAWLKPA